MAGHLKELKTNRTRSKEGMLEYLEDLKKKVSEDTIESVVLIFGDTEGLIQSQVIGDISFTEAIGMMDSAKFAFQVSHFFDHGDE